MNALIYGFLLGSFLPALLALLIIGNISKVYRFHVFELYRSWAIKGNFLTGLFCLWTSKGAFCFLGFSRLSVSKCKKPQEVDHRYLYAYGIHLFFVRVNIKIKNKDYMKRLGYK